MRTLLLTLISLALAGEAAAAAGRVEFVIGGATVSGRDGAARAAARGAELDSGDTVRTTDGRVQIRFTDGAYVSLQPNTEFSIREYLYEGRTDGSERGFFALAKGAMRTVTGAIGRVNRDSYRVTTPTATIGIRGTGGLFRILEDLATLVRATSGTLFVANQADVRDVPARTVILAPADVTAPLLEVPQEVRVGPTPIRVAAVTPLPVAEELAPPSSPSYDGPAGADSAPAQGDQVTAEGLPEGLPAAAPAPGTTPLASGTGYAAVASYSVSFSPFLDLGTNTAAVFDASGQLTSMTFSADQYSIDGGSHADFGTDGILAWGRWIGPVVISSGICDGTCPGTNYNANQGLHYVIGMPTATMPTSGTNVTYALAGGTRPTFNDGSAAPGTFSGSLLVTFNAGSTDITLQNFSVALGGRGYALSGSTTTSQAFFSISPNVTGTAGGACSGGCLAAAAGFFAGANAERAGLGYHIRDGVFTSPTRDIHGAAAFRRQ